MKPQTELDKRVAEIRRMHHDGNTESFHRTGVGGYLRDFVYRAKGFEGETLERAVDVITANKKLWVDEMMVGEHGLVFHIHESQPWKNALTTFVAFVVAGFVPLVPYFAGLTARETFPYAIAATAIILF